MSEPTVEAPTPDFRKAIDAVLAEGDTEATIRPDVQPVKVNMKAAEAHKEVFVTMSNLILSRLESKPPRARIQDGFPFVYLSGCLICGAVFYNSNDPEEVCSHCPKGKDSDLYISRKESYVLSLVGSLLGLWEVWPVVDDVESWKDDAGRKQLSALPLLSRPTKTS
jgi:hypothetical protein